MGLMKLLSTSRTKEAEKAIDIFKKMCKYKKTTKRRWKVKRQTKPSPDTTE